MAAHIHLPHTPRRFRSLSEWFRRHCRALPVVLAATMLSGPALQGAPPRFQSKDANPKPTAEDRETVIEGPPVKLNYPLPKNWDQILRDVAEQSGSTLVADRVPRGTFSRRDKNEYTREEALRIINKEIEKLGFRAIEKGQYIVVLDLPSQRPRYERPTVSKPGTAAPAPQSTPQASAPKRQFQRVTPVQDSQEAPEIANTGSRKRNDSAIQQAGFEEETAGVGPRSSAEDLLLDKTTRPGSDEPATVVVFRARNQRAATLAKHVFRGFRDRAELLDAGRNGLPAFRVRPVVTEPKHTGVQFAVAIDEAKEELLVDGRPAEAEAMLKLLRLLDIPELDAEPIQLVSTTRTACQVALQFDGQAAQIQRARAALPVAQAAPIAEPDPFAQADGPAAQPAADMAPLEKRLPGPLGDRIGNLKGEVSIESVPDLGVLILRGNAADVEQVMQVIRELEKLSEQTAPQLELLFLKNVNSEALAELLTTVYESLTKFPGKATQPRQSVAILPVSKPNAILIVAPLADVEGIKSLADELDKPVDPETEFQVFHLQTVVATQVETMLTDFYTEPKGLSARVKVRSDVRTNSVIVSARPNDLDEVATLIRRIDQAEEVASSQLKVFPLQNAVATELAAVINVAIQSVLSPPSSQGASSVFGAGGGGGGAQVSEDFRDVRSSVLQFLAVDSDGERKLKSGILADIRITPDPRMNALLVSAPEASLSLIGELIKALDRPTSQVAEIKVFTLANADSQLMVQQLQALFNVTATGQGGQQRQQTGIQVAGAEDASSGLIPLRFSVDTRTNSVIAIGGADALRVVEAIMLRLDESDVRERRNTIYRLKNSPSDGIALAITNFFTSQSDLAANDPNLVSSVEQLEREVIVVSEPVSNSLLISATPRYNDEILRLIEKLDAAPQQVIIQALIVEVELNDTDEFGIELGFQDSILFDRSIIDNILTTSTTLTDLNGVTQTQTNVISQSSSPGYLFGNPVTPLGNNTSAGIGTTKVGTQGLSNFSVGRTNGDLGFGGLVLSASSESVSFLLRALSENRQVRVLSRPQIRTLDNQQAQIQQGQTVPIVEGVTLSATGIANPNVTRDDAGVILTVTPRISPDGNVVMQLTAEKSQYNLNSGVPIFTDANTGNVVTSPVKDISTAVTTISVPSGQTVVMGGLITSRTDEVHRKVPWLGDIPILGYAFRYDFLQTRRTELLIFLTPRIIWDDAEAEHIKDVEMARIHFIESEAEEMHGPLRGVPAEEMYPDGGLDPRYPMPMQGFPEGTILEQRLPNTETSPVPKTIQPGTPPAPAADNSPPTPMSEAAAGGRALRAVPVSNSAPPAAPEAAGPRPIPTDADVTPVAPPPPAEEGVVPAGGEVKTSARRTKPKTYDSQIVPVGHWESSSTPSGSVAKQMVAEFEDPPAPTPPATVRVQAPAASKPTKPSQPGAVKLGRKPWSSVTPK